jgi:hypothetical protein
MQLYDTPWGWLQGSRNICRVFLKCFRETLYRFFLNKVHLVGDKTLTWYWCLHQSSRTILTADSYLSNITSTGIKSAKERTSKIVICLFRYSRFLRVCLFFFVYFFFISYRRRILGLLCSTELTCRKNCLRFSDVGQERQGKTRDVPISRKSCTKRQLTALRSLTRGRNPQWLSLHLFVKNFFQ